MADPGSISSRWLSGPTLHAAALNTALDIIPVFKPDVAEGQATPAALYSAVVGDVPSWVEAARAPSGDLPILLSNFASAEYWSEGAVRALGDIWIENTDWYNWDPAAIIPGSGISDTPFGGPVYTGDIPTLFPDGFTIVVECTVPLTPAASYTEYSFLDPATYDNEVYFYVVEATVDAAQSNGMFQYDTTPNSWSMGWGAWADGIFRFAANVTPDASAYSVLGAAIVTSDNGGETYDLSLLPTFGVGGSAEGVFTRSVALYPLQPDVDLPDLSTLASGSPATYQALTAISHDRSSLGDGTVVDMVTWEGGTYPFVASSIGVALPSGATLVTSTPQSDVGNLTLVAVAPDDYPGLAFRITDTLSAHDDTGTATLTVTE